MPFNFVESKLNNLTINLNNKSGRNNLGQITIRHRGGRRNWRFVVVDHHRRNISLPGLVLSYVKISCSKPFAALVKYACGSLSYIIAPIGLNIGHTINSFFLNLPDNRIRHVGNLVLLRFLKQNDIIFSNFTKNKVRSFYARAAGTFCKLKYRTHSRDFFVITIPSGERLKLSIGLSVFIGRNSNMYHRKEVIGSAGYNRHLGIRPTVRGVAMNPVDHPHGGRTKTSQPEVSPWGWVAKQGY